jgi:hypothetical protein
MADRLSPAAAIPLLEAFWDLDGYSLGWWPRDRTIDGIFEART